jgi:hypothetical protein
MKELVFSIKDAFNADTPSGCLAQYVMVNSFIFPLIRGEEWFQNSIADTKWRGDNELIPKHWYE